MKQALAFAQLKVGTLLTGTLAHTQHGFWTVAQATGKSLVTLVKVNGVGTWEKVTTDTVVRGGKSITVSANEYAAALETLNEARKGRISLGFWEVKATTDAQRHLLKEVKAIARAEAKELAKEQAGS